MNGRLESRYGDIHISSDAIATLAGATAVECFGIIGMAAVGMKDGLVRLLRKDSLKKGIEVLVENNEVTLKLHVIVAYGLSISAVADNLISNVTYKVSQFTGMKVRDVQIFVEGVRRID